MHLPSKLIVRQKVEPIEIFTGFETSNRYQILDMDGNERFYAYEEGSFFARNILGTRRPLTIKVIDKEKNEILSITRDWFFFRAGYRVTGKTDGAIVQKKWFIKKSFEILKDKHSILYCKNSIPHPWTFRIQESKQEIGRITKKWSGAKDIFSDADNFLIDFAKIRKEYRLMILATALAIDTRVFESKK
ncbi:MAG: phospholipid scramblase-related protein [Candidatus Woesearchaeota archaeon]